MSKDIETERAEMQALLDANKATSNDPNIGRKLSGGHIIIKKLGEGGMGSVYLAYHFKTGQKVAVKVLQPGVSDVLQYIERFHLEAQLLVSLHHNVIPDVKYLDESGTQIFLVTEFIEGEPFGNYIDRNHERKTEATFVVSLLQPMVQVCDALATAHSKGVVHRDIKPDNLMVVLQPNGQIVIMLIDFGIAKQTRLPSNTVEGYIIGTLGFLSPEQVTGKNVTKLSDIYSLGVVLYELFAGELFIPNTGNMWEMTSKTMNLLHAQERLVKLGSPYQRAFVSLMIEMSPQDRFGGMYEVIGALKYIIRLMELEIDGGNPFLSVSEMLGVLIDLIANKGIQGNLEIMGALRVLQRMIDINSQHIRTTAPSGVPAISEPAAAQPVPAASLSMPGGDVEVNLGSLDLAMQPSFLGGHPDFSNSDLNRIQAPQASASMARPVPAAPPHMSALHSAGTMIAPGEGDPTVPVPVPAMDEIPQEAEPKPKSRKAMIFGIFGILALIGIINYVVITTKNTNDPGKRDEPTASVQVSDASVTVVKPGPDAANAPKVTKDATVLPPSIAPTAELLTDDVIDKVYEALRDRCAKNDPKRSQYEAVPAFEMTCLRSEIRTLSQSRKGHAILALDELMARFCFSPRTTWDKSIDKECSHAQKDMKNLFYWSDGAKSRIYRQRLDERYPRREVHRKAFMSKVKTRQK